MYCLIAFTLLLFEIGCSYGHTLPRKEILDNVDVYSVRENNHDTLTFVNPKSTKPTVKEIIFYHFIEKPYDQSQVVITHREETVQGPDFDDSRRPFTNGHGIQIHLDSDEDDDDDDDDDKTSDESTESTHSNDGDSSDDDISNEGGEDMTTDHDTESVSDDSESGDKSNDSDDPKENSSSIEEDNEDAIDRKSNLPAQDDIVSSSSKEFELSSLLNDATESVETSTSEMNMNRDDISASETTTDAEVMLTEPVEDEVIDEVESEKKAARNIIFNQLRERYQESWNPTVVSSRKKRDIEYNDSEDVEIFGGKELPEMPEAPILSDLDLDELRRNFTNENISSEKPESPEMPEAPILPELDLDELRKNFTDENISSEKTEHPELRNYNEEEMAIGDGIEEVIRPFEEGDVDVSKEDAPNRPRTYGMKLMNGSGYVWNELATKPETPNSPELNLDELPQNNRDGISSENAEHPELNNDHEDANIEGRTEEIIGKALSPYEEGEDVSYPKEDVPNKPRTYGMELHNGGYVWNELAATPESPILPEQNVDELPKNTRDEISTESPVLPEMTQSPFLPELNLDELPENTKDEISTESPVLPEMPQTPFLPELNLDELPENVRDEITSEKPELPEMPESPFLPELNSAELPQNNEDKITSEKPEFPAMPEMPEAPILPELNLDELPDNTRDEISSEKPELPVLPEAPTLPEPNLDESQLNIRDMISTESPKWPEMPEAPILPELNLDELPRITGDEISSEKPKLPEMAEAPILPELNLEELPQDIRDVISTENPERSEIQIKNEESERGIEDRTAVINSEVLTTDQEEDVDDSTTQNPRTYGMEMDSGSRYVWNGSEEKSAGDGEEHIRANLEGEDINVYERETTEMYNNNYDETKKEIEHRIDEMISEVMRPYEEGEDEALSNEDAPKKPRTYGMKLENGAGYVWNDLWSSPGMSYSVGDPSKISSEEHEENVTKIDEPDKTQGSGDSTLDLDDIFVNKENYGDERTEKIVEYIENDKDKNKPNLDGDTLVHEKGNEDGNLSNEEDWHLIIENSTYSYIDLEQSTADTTEANYNNKEQLEGEENITEKVKISEDSEAHQPKLAESIIEILKDQDNDFWIWLQDWTSTYMDLLMKHIRKIVVQEVRKQLNLRKDCLGYENSPLETDFSESQKDGKVITKEDTYNKGETITIGGIEIPVTHDTNFDISDILNSDKLSEIYGESQIELLKGRRHKDKETTIAIGNVESLSDRRKPEKEGKINASNIFGNSYNNDKVTNIYIFYPKDGSEKLIEDLKLEKDINKTAFIFEKPECTKTEEKEPAKEQPIINDIKEITTVLNPIEEMLQPTESSNNDEENVDENERDTTEISQLSTSETPIANVDIEMTTDNPKNEQSIIIENEEGITEKNDTSEISVVDDSIKISEDKPREVIAEGIEQDRIITDNKRIAPERKNKEKL